MKESLFIPIAKFIWGFASGVIASLLASYIFYRSQRDNDEKKQRELLFVLYRIWEQNRDAEGVRNKIDAKLDHLTSNKSVDDKMAILLDQFKQIDSRLKKDFRSNKTEQYVEDVLTYKAVADAWSGAAVGRFNFSILDENGHINISSINRAHKGMFPEGYAWGAKLRQQAVAIMGEFQASGKSVNPCMSSYTVNFVQPEEVPSAINDLLEHWNNTVAYLIKEDLKSKSEALAHFHQQFLFIHPYLDGNGRVARIILNEQASYLFGQEIKIEFDRKQYYESLHLADLREIAKLSALIRVSIENHPTIGAT